MAKVIKKTIGGGNTTKEIGDHFSKLFDVDTADVHIIEPKFREVIFQVSTVCRIIESFEGHLDKTDKKRFMKRVMALQYERLVWEKAVKNADYDGNINRQYADFKKSKTCNDMLEIYGSLKEYEEFILNEDDDFIREFPGDIMYLIRKHKINFKYIYLYLHRDKLILKKSQQYILTVLKILCKATKKIFTTITSPDVDVKAISGFLQTALLDLEKHLPRCREAFKYIRNSVGVLENNFGVYYKDYLGTQDKTIILQHYVGDILKKNANKPTLTLQFRKIINFLRDKSVKNSKQDPKVKELLDHMKTLESITEKYNKHEERTKRHTKSANKTDKKKNKSSPPKKPPPKTPDHDDLDLSEESSSDPDVPSSAEKK